MAAIRDRVKKKLVGPGARTIPAFLSMQNPVIVDPKGGTRFDIEHEYDDDGEPTGKVHGNGQRLVDSIEKTVNKYKKYDPTLDAGQVIGHVMEHAGLYDGATAHQVEDALRNYDGLHDMYHNGHSMSNEFIRDVWRNAGHDGIIMDASRFKNMTGVQGTKHYVVFDPRQIKSSLGNTGAYDPKSKDFGKSE